MEQDNATVVEKVENTNPQGDISTKDSDVQKEAKGFMAFLSKLAGGEKVEQEEKPDEKDKKDKKDEPSFEERLKAEREKWEKEQEEKANFEKLSEKEKQELLEKEREEKIKNLETELLKKNLKDEAVSLLNKEGYPVGLAEILNFSSKEDMEKSLKTVTEVFKDTLALAVNERLKGKTPEGLGSAGSRENNFKDEIANAVKGGF